LPSSEQLLNNPGALCNMVRRIAVAAGQITLNYFDMLELPAIGEKSDGSPVTTADRESEKFITSSLRDLMPDVPVIAEEETAGGLAQDLSTHEYFWLVDPLDATKEFMAGGENYTVNIGLVKKDTPVMGIVYAPALGVLYAGYGETALRWSEETGKDKKINVRQAPAAGLTVMSSLYHADDAAMDKFLSAFKVEKILKRASALKICAIAEGKADLYPRLGPTSEWDTAGAEAILRAAGGTLTDLQGKNLVYGSAERKFANPHFAAASFPWFDEETA
jgi:3'(2'), 5'-bisphosphate nucleotidase